MTRRSLTLVGGGPELAKLVGQLVVPAKSCSVIGSKRSLTAAHIPFAIGVPIDTTPPSIDLETRPGDAYCSQARLAVGIARAIEQSPETERLIVVLDETDDVTSAAFTVLNDDAVRELVQLDGIVATVDAVHMSTRLLTDQPIDTPRGLDRLAIADRILIARSRDVTPPALGAVGHVLRSINQTGPIIAPAIAPCSLDELLDIDAWSGSPTVGRRPDSASPVLGPDAPSMVVCHTTQPLDPDALDRWLDLVLTDHASRVLRLLGTVSSTIDRQRIYLHGVRSCLLRSCGPIDGLDGGDEPSLVALVGRQLPADALQSSFSSCCR